MEKKNMLLGVAAALVFLVGFMLDRHAIIFFEAIQNPVLDHIMNWITNIGSVFVVLIFMTTLFFWEEKKRGYILPLWVSLLTTIVITYGLKGLIARARPFESMIIPLIGLMDYSFPSAHVAIAFSVVPIFDKEFPTLKWFWILFATLVGISRMYIGAHYLSDVIAGAIVGYVAGFLFLKYRKKLFNIKK